MRVECENDACMLQMVRRCQGVPAAVVGAGKIIHRGRGRLTDGQRARALEVAAWVSVSQSVSCVRARWFLLTYLLTSEVPPRAGTVYDRNPIAVATSTPERTARRSTGPRTATQPDTLTRVELRLQVRGTMYNASQNTPHGPTGDYTLSTVERLSAAAGCRRRGGQRGARGGESWLRRSIH